MPPHGAASSVNNASPHRKERARRVLHSALLLAAAEGIDLQEALTGYPRSEARPLAIAQTMLCDVMRYGVTHGARLDPAGKVPVDHTAVLPRMVRATGGALIEVPETVVERL